MVARPHIDLRQLFYFNAVAEEGSISRAAVRLHLSQPPLTVQIQNLEEELGVLLFKRHKRGVELTAAGTALVDEARNILARAEYSVERVRQVGRGEVGALRIGIVGSIMWGEFVDMVRRYHAAYPRVEWSLHELGPKAQIEALLDCRIDVGFWRSPLSRDDVTCTRVTTEAVGVALPSAHRLASRKALALQELAEEPMVLMNPEVSEFASYLIDACRVAGFEPRIVHKANEPATLLALVSTGAGAALLPQSLQRIAWPGVVFLPLTRPGLSADLHMFTRHGETSTLVANFAALTRESFQVPPRKRPHTPGAAGSGTRNSRRKA